MDSKNFSEDGHVATLRNVYETKELGSIMGRFFSAVSTDMGGEE